jgi:uncharacterized protein
LRKPHNWHMKLQRAARYHLLIPLKRTPHPPEYTARGVAVGMLVAMTPTVGIQMFIIAGLWLVITRLFNWPFSLFAGLAYTWTTNAFTMLPLYYLFYVTGQVMLGHFDDINGFDRFSELVGSIGANPDQGFWQTLWLWSRELFSGWGVPMFVGSIPWAIFSAWAGYVVTYSYITRHRRKRLARMRSRGGHALLAPIGRPAVLADPAHARPDTASQQPDQSRARAEKQ